MKMTSRFDPFRNSREDAWESVFHALDRLDRVGPRPAIDGDAGLTSPRRRLGEKRARNRRVTLRRQSPDVLDIVFRVPVSQQVVRVDSGPGGRAWNRHCDRLAAGADA